jgi:hypothetical protein
MNITSWASAGAGFLLGLFGGNLVNKLLSKLGQGIKGFYRAIVDETRKEFNEQVQSGKFDFDKNYEEIRKDYEDKPQKIKQWLIKYMPSHMYGGLMLQGQLYLFNYDDPKYKEQLEYYDPSPLVLAFGTYMAETGNLVEYGVNLHFLPLKVRKAFMKDIFDLFRNEYKDEMYSNKPRAINAFTWETLQPYVEKYSINFAVRSYITTLRTNTITFDYKDWPIATLIPSKGFLRDGGRNSIAEKQIEAFYMKHVMMQRKKRKLT